MLTVSSDVSILGRQRQPLSVLLWELTVTHPSHHWGNLHYSFRTVVRGLNRRHPARQAASSKTQGQSVCSLNKLTTSILVGRKGGTKVFKYGRKSPWVPTLTELFPKIQADAGSWLGTKNALYYCAQSANSFSWVLFVSSYTTAIVSPHLPGSFTKLVRARETFIFYFPNQKRRNYRWVEKTFGMLSAGAIQFAPRIFCFWRITMYRK